MSRILGGGSAITILIFLLSPVVLADDGRIPVHVSGPATISTPGYYRLTGDLALAGGEEIQIDSDDVVLDLGNHAISKPATDGEVAVRVGEGVSNAIIRRGRITGSGTAVKYVTDGIVRARIRLEALEITGTANNAVDLEGVEHVDVVNCRIVDAGAYGVRASGQTGSFGGRFTGNALIGPGLGGLVLEGLRNAELRGNLVADHTAPGTGSAGIWLMNIAGVAAGGNRLVENVIRAGGSDAGGVIIESHVGDNLVLDNVVTGNGGAGIHVRSSGNHVKGNVVAGGVDHGIVLDGSGNTVVRNEIEGNRLDGVLVFGGENLIDDNLLAGNRAWGIQFAAGTGHAYRNNVFRDNGNGGGTGSATDAGGNVY
jgi:parallel beta-helix repeat protein